MNKDEFLKRVEEIKEVLASMPQNNKKNREKYLMYIKEQLDIFSLERDAFIKEIKKRVNKTIDKEKKYSADTDKKSDDNNLIIDLEVFNSWNTPYQKQDLDRIIFEINHYYKDNLDALNEDIKDAIKCFENVGIKLTINDFCYSSYVRQYMDVILNNHDDGKVIKKRLDDVYWKSPKVMNQIACNFNYLYYKYEKKFLRYYEDKKKEILSHGSYVDLVHKYSSIKRDLFMREFNMGNIISSILDGSINIKDYSDDKLKSYESSMGDGDVDIESYDDLYFSLNEYRVYKEYSFIIDKVKELYQNKGQYKNVYKNLRKEISKLEGNLFKVNKKINMQNKFFKNENKIELLELQVNNLTDSLIEKYSSLQDEYVHEVISGWNDNVSYFDILKFISSHYLYFRKLLIENQEEISDIDILNKRRDLVSYLYNDELHFLPNISIMDDANIPMIIGDKYQLVNIKISSEEISENSDNYMELLKKIKIINVIHNSDIDYLELLFQVDTKDIISDNNNG